MTRVCINAYGFRNAASLVWPVRRYSVRRRNGIALAHEDRGSAKNAAYSLRSQHRALCPGWGFVVDVGPGVVVLPGAWQIPSGAEHDDLIFELDAEFSARADEPTHDAIVAGILREGLKRHVKDARFEQLGPLWQNYDRFCQMPSFHGKERYVFCRSFFTQAKRMASGRWAIAIGVTTAVVDGYSIGDYLARGEADELAEAIQWKRGSRSRRDNAPSAVRAYVHGDGYGQGRIVEIDEPDVLAGYGALSPKNQTQLASLTVMCREFKKPPERLPVSSLHLIVDTQQTEELHGETIIPPAERLSIAARVRQQLSGADIYGTELLLDESPLDLSATSLLIAPPAICVRKANGTAILPRPEPITHQTMYQRARRRKDHVVRHGFLITRPMRPLIGVPDQMGGARALRLQADATEILRQHGITNVTFTHTLYKDVSALHRQLEAGRHDTLLAVLPPRTGEATEVHEEIKRRFEVPSQCMRERNVVPATWAERPGDEFRRKEPRLAHALQTRLEGTVMNLLVKHNWVPFVPAEAFHYNVQVGLDVGGLHNTHAMACVGYGFSDAHGGLTFRLGEIPIVGQRREPMPPDALLNGLRDVFERVAEASLQAGITPDFSRTLFYRDGPLLGHGDEWNEREALIHLHAVLAKRGWIQQPALWTALEVMKEAEGLRVFEMCPQPENPLVGRCTFAFADDHVALVSPTGRPYLSQGTAAPLKVRMVDLVGRADFAAALRDLVWQCDMGFTKPDMGFSMPWVLHVADTGALQASRSYRITGIAA